ncbi:hypothetical protein Tdes44962_MAKER05265 [Teratosphaeria destructans]|uniref:Uncharacterized protein n=1 Tax=Teratosphaeria destructans TaxID=418781 RepID=A0A9W7VYU1_9PEZI|nr:hypothetical protein Tdes44962_MAKER05265 [Teratosphaeria destructans]
MTLHNGYRWVIQEALSCPPRVVWIWGMVGIKNTNNVGAGVESEEMIEIVGFGLRLRDLHHNKVGDVVLQIMKFRFQRLNRSVGVVDQIHSKPVFGIFQLLHGVEHLITNDVLLVREVGHNDQVDDR